MFSGRGLVVFVFVLILNTCGNQGVMLKIKVSISHLCVEDVSCRIDG